MLNVRVLFLSVALLSGGCAGQECDGVIGRLCVQNNSEQSLWPELMAALFFIGVEHKTECPERGPASTWLPEGTLVVVPEWSLVPANGRFADGSYSADSEVITIRRVAFLEDTALVHEIVQHVIPHQCLGDSTANAEHSVERKLLSTQTEERLAGYLRSIRVELKGQDCARRTSHKAD